MVAQTITIDRIQRSATVTDVIRDVLGSDVDDLDQHVLFYVHDKREKRIKSTTHLHGLLAKSKHRVHFVVKKRLKPKCQSTFSTKAKLLLQNMRLLFDDDIESAQKELLSGKRCPSFEALNIECKRRRTSGQVYNIYHPATLSNKDERDFGLVHRNLFSPDELCNEFQSRRTESENCSIVLEENERVEDQESCSCSLNGRGSEYKLLETIDFPEEKNDIKKARHKTIHPSKLYKISIDDGTNNSDKVKELLRTCISTDQQKKHNVSDVFIDNKAETKREVKEANSFIPVDEGEYVMLKQETETRIDKTAEESDSAFEDDSDLSF